MSNVNSEIWDELAQAYAAELQTSLDEVHFGVGIVGNKELPLIPYMEAGTAVDLACGSGENLVALSKLGYRVVGIDASTEQLQRARSLLARYQLEGALLQGDICNHPAVSNEKFDLVLCVSAAHFCRHLNAFINVCAKLAKPGGIVVIAVPHALDMITDVVERGGERLLVIDDYFPPEGRLRKAHYWEKFAGRNALAEGLEEYLCRPSDLVNGFCARGFQINGLWEPSLDPTGTAPCQYRDPDPWFVEVLYTRVPQYLILKARAQVASS